MPYKEERDLFSKVQHLWEPGLQLLDAEVGAVLTKERDDTIELSFLLYGVTDLSVLTVGLEGGREGRGGGGEGEGEREREREREREERETETEREREGVQ